MTPLLYSLIQSKLTQIVRFSEEMQSAIDLPYEEYKDEFTRIRTAERDLELLIEFAADTINHLLLDRGLPPSESYRDAFNKAARADMIATALAERLMPLASLRNHLVHEYDTEFDPEKAYNAFCTAPKAFQEFAEKIFAILEK